MSDHRPADTDALEPFEDFLSRHVGTSAEEQEAMLKILGYDDLDALVDAAIPGSVRSLTELDLPPAVSERAVLDELRAGAARNVVAEPMIGLGYAGTITPAVIRRNVLESPAWYTAYTPYQPEISQGRLEALLNFQTMVDRSDWPRHGQRLAARREHRGGRGGDADAAPDHGRVEQGARRRRLPAPDHRSAHRRGLARSASRPWWPTWARASPTASTSGWSGSTRGARAPSVTSPR